DGGAGDLDGVADGNIKTNWVLPADAPGNSFLVMASGESSHSTAQASFTGLTTWVMTNPTDYPPGQTAHIFAGGFQPGEAVRFQVSNQTNGNVYTPSWAVTDGGPDDLDGVADGHITTGWTVVSDAANSTLL